MDTETREFLEKVASNLERRIAESEQRLIAHVDKEIGSLRTDIADFGARLDGVATLAQSANRRDRTRELRMLGLESRFGEFESRLLDLEGEDSSK